MKTWQEREAERGVPAVPTAVSICSWSTLERTG